MSESEKKATRDSAKSMAKSGGFTAEERAAMKQRAKEVKAEERANQDRAQGERDVRAKIEEMPEHDRAMATRLHEIISTNAPVLAPRLWYGMPAYTSDGKVVCFYQSSDKFNTRYATFGFNDIARIDDGTMWPTAYALMELTPADEEKIAALVKKAVS